jgi:hypothetical protein
MAKSSSSEKRKKLILAVVGCLFVLILVYQLFFGGPAPRPAKKTANSNSAVATTSPGPSNPVPQAPKGGAARESERLMEIQLADLTPLDFSRAYQSGSAAVSPERGSIFAYYVEPPKPPPPPPPPPPIGLQSVQPSFAVAGTPRNITLTISGSKIPADAQVYMDGGPRPTKRVNENQLSIELQASEYASPRSINIEVKSQSDPTHNNSNTIQFTSQPAPAPQFRYIARLGENAVFELNATKEIKRLRRGDLIQGVWRIDSISDTGVELTHTQYEIKSRVPLQEKPK